MQDRPNESRPRHPRAERIAQVIVSAFEADQDYRSIPELCRLSAIGVAPGTFRGWCRGEHVKGADVLAFARVLRGFVMAGRHGGDPAEYLDADYRTVRLLFGRAGSDGSLASGLAFEDLCRRQGFIKNSIVIGEVLRLLAEGADSPGTPSSR